jgi:C-terminal processing protease CtpA/Prc
MRQARLLKISLCHTKDRRDIRLSFTIPGMRRLLLVLVLTPVIVQAQAPVVSPASDFAAILNFETEQTGKMPRGWGGGPPETIAVDGEIVHGGRWSVRLARSAADPQGFSTITKSIPIDFQGSTLEWRGFLRTENVSAYTGLWMREDGAAGSVAFDNMQQRQVNGTRGWSEYSITLPIRPDARSLFFGVLVAGTGTVWADDLQLLVDGKPVWEAPKLERPRTAIELDREFDAGSGIVVNQLSEMQTQSLATLGKVWGFLKYHHPVVTAGRRHWDYELFRVIPKVLAARDSDTANATLHEWIQSLGDVTPCNSCATLRTDDLHLSPDVGWIDQETVLGRDLAGLLRKIYRNRAPDPQFYVSLARSVGNPVFENEPAYPNVSFPDAGYQLLALYRFWNAVEYWYPDRNLLDQDWNAVLAEFIPRLAGAKNRDEYQIEMLALIARVTDTHANLWSLPSQIRPPAGACQLPVITRFVESRAVVTGYSEPTAGPLTGLNIGDVIESLDGVPVEELVRRWAPFYPASNQPTRLRDIGRAMTRGACTTVRAGIRRGSQTMIISGQRLALTKLDQTERSHDLPGETFRMLSDDVAYLKLSSVKASQVPEYMTRAKSTQGLVIDIRNYPSEFVVFAMGSLFPERVTPFVRFTSGDLQNPGAFHWGEPLSLTPSMPHYPGKVVILVDETTQSQAEYTTMAFRAGPRSVVVGSTTAGADGNVSVIPLPGGHRTMISGLGVFYPDKKPTQRVGIIPDVEVAPTIAGVRAGRDEALDEALRQILGRQTSVDQIDKLLKP